jgi:hypothetical protein
MSTQRSPRFFESDFAKSSYCTSPPGGCVEVAAKGGFVAIRDTKDPGQVLVFSKAEWEAFVKGVKTGEFDAK